MNSTLSKGCIGLRTLILSCNTGEGHNSCAKAIKEYYESKGEFCEIKDSLAFASKRLSDFISNWHVRLYRHMPYLFGAGYGIFEKHPSMLESKSMVYKALTRGGKKLRDYIVENEFDCVICTHVFAAMTLSRTCKEYSLNLKTGLVYTDYTCFPGTSSCELTYFFTPHFSLKEEFLKAGVKEEQIVPTGIPVRQDFYKSIPREEAKEQLGIKKDKIHIVMMSGSMGCGPIKKLAKLIAEGKNENCQLSVVCGTNKRMKKQLDKAIGETEGVNVIGYANNVSQLLDSADLYFTKPGGISVSEATVKSVPMLLIQAVEGCETHNFKFFTSLGAAVSAKKPKELSKMGLELIGDKAKLESMRAAYGKEMSRNCAEIIYNTMK